MTSVQKILSLSSSPVAIGFLDAPPPGVEKFQGHAPAGCAFWKLAMGGRSLYTVASDHYNCAVGSHTHGIPLPAERAQELMDTVGFMVENNYIRMEEVPGIPTLKKSPAVVAYAPADSATFPADVVVVAVTPAQAMLLYEAAARLGGSSGTMPTLGRPGCAALPFAQQTGSPVLSFGCKGNRTFTGLSDAEIYFAIPGSQWEKLVSELGTIASSNAAMANYYNAKLVQFPIL